MLPSRIWYGLTRCNTAVLCWFESSPGCVFERLTVVFEQFWILDRWLWLLVVTRLCCVVLCCAFFFGPLLVVFAGYIYRAGSWVRVCSGTQRLVLGLRIGAKFVP